MDQKRIDAFNALVDDRIMTYGVINTMVFLSDFGFTVDEFVEMGFDEENARLIVAETEEGRI